MARILLLSLFAFSIPSFALTYFQDSSCNAYPAVTRAITEALRMAHLSDERLNSNDKDIGAAFQRIYNTDTANVGAVAEVRRIMSGIAQLTPSANRDGADIRIHCDQDIRWTLQPDSMLPDGTTPAKNPNSGRKPEKQTWYDPINEIYNVGPPPCTIPKVKGATTGDGQKDVISLCKPYIEAQLATIEDLGKKNFKKVKLSGKDISTILSRTVLHEFTHVSVFGTDDIEPPYNWANIIAKSTADALKNADNYAFFGLLAVLGNKGWKLSDDKQGAKDGQLITGKTYTKRMASALRSTVRCKERSARAQDPACKAMVEITK